LHQQSNIIAESLEIGDLAGAISSTIHIDEFKSKMGEDKDIIVFSFKLIDKKPAEDLVNFIEKGYDWVLDADQSSGSMSNGDYVLFVETERNKNFPKHLVELLDDMSNLVGDNFEGWRFAYHKTEQYQPVTEENILRSVPLSADEYEAKYSEKPVDEMKIAAGIPVKSKFNKTPQLEQLQIWAGIK
jgi:hypothetical protein